MEDGPVSSKLGVVRTPCSVVMASRAQFLELDSLIRFQLQMNPPGEPVK